jgi:cysteine-rich repeat protein
VTLSWKLEGAATSTDIPLTATGSTYSGDLPAQADGSVIRYHVTVALSNGASLSFPDNPADPDYQLYVGAVTQIQCFDFEGGIGDWTHAGMQTNAMRPADEWEVGMPLGIGGDPTAAHGGSNVLGQDLGDGAVTGGNNDGLYRNNGKSWAISPAIDLKGFTHARLQYYRWLGVEDGAYDQATITANDMPLWNNLTSPGMPDTEVNHIDKEWRFADVDLTPAITAGMPMTLKFEVDADQGLSFSGWNLDDVCIVGTADPAQCGNGTLDPGETCDDGNTTAGDGCSASCQTEPGGMGGATGDNGGCCSANTKPSGAIVLSLLTIGLVLRRRRKN